MVKISNNQIITMNRGDYFTCPLFLNDGNAVNPEQYVLQDGDEVYFGVCECGSSWEQSLIRKKYTKSDLDTNNNVNIILQTSDTEFLVPGKYYYEVKCRIKQPDNTYLVDTVVTRKDFIILE